MTDFCFSPQVKIWSAHLYTLYESFSLRAELLVTSNWTLISRRIALIHENATILVSNTTFDVLAGASRSLCGELSGQQGCWSVGTFRDHAYPGHSRHGSTFTFREYKKKKKTIHLSDSKYINKTMSKIYFKFELKILTYCIFFFFLGQTLSVHLSRRQSRSELVAILLSVQRLHSRCTSSRRKRSDSLVRYVYNNVSQNMSHTRDHVDVSLLFTVQRFEREKRCQSNWIL